MRGKVFARCALIAALATPAAVYAQATSGSSGSSYGSGSGSSYGSASGSSAGSAMGSGSTSTPRTKGKAANNPRSRGSAETMSDADFKVLAHVHDVNLAEIEMGKLAQERAQSPAVKKFAQMIVRDHTSNDKTLTNLATARNMVLPTTPSDPDEVAGQQKAMETMDSLRALTGPDFDRQFLTAMQDDHQREIDRAEDAIKNISDTKLTAVMKQTRPVLIKHRDQAKKLLQTTAKANRTGGARTTGASGTSDANAVGAGSAGAYGSGSASGSATGKTTKHKHTGSGSGSGSGH